MACRDRTQAELRRVNYYFNPSNSLLTKYSRICYLYNTNVESGKKETYDTYLNMPITCADSSTFTSKCKKTVFITAKLYCDSTEYTSAKVAATANEKKFMFDLTYFYSISSTSTTNVTFSTIETLGFY